MLNTSHSHIANTNRRRKMFIINILNSFDSRIPSSFRYKPINRCTCVHICGPYSLIYSLNQTKWGHYGQLTETSFSQNHIMISNLCLKTDFFSFKLIVFDTRTKLYINTTNMRVPKNCCLSQLVFIFPSNNTYLAFIIPHKSLWTFLGTACWQSRVWIKVYPNTLDTLSG